MTGTADTTANATISEVHTTQYSLHPFYGYVCTPNATIDFSDSVPARFAHGAIAHVNAEGFRGADIPVHKPADETWIGWFGGSVAFSAPASDDRATIGARLESLLNASGRRRVRVLDFSLPGGHQPQQLIIMMLNLPRLDGVIVFDGVNETVVPAYYNRGVVPGEFPYRPFYEALYGRTITDRQVALGWLMQQEESTSSFWRHIAPTWTRRGRSKRHEWLRSELRASQDTGARFDSLFPHDRAQHVEQALREGVSNWLRSTVLMHQLCAARGVEALFTIQPVPERQKPLTNAEQAYLLELPEVIEIRAHGYTAVLRAAEEASRSGARCVPLTDVFEGVREDIYTDVIHFEDRGCDRVAQRVAALLHGWSCLR